MLNARNKKFSKQVQLKETIHQEMVINRNNLRLKTLPHIIYITGNWTERKAAIIGEGGEKASMALRIMNIKYIYKYKT